MDKRTFLKSGALAAGATVLGSAFANNTYAAGLVPCIDKAYDKGEFILPDLNYSYDALEEAIDPQTMELHHSIHHQGYVNGLNKATNKIKEMIVNDDYSLVKHWERELAFHGSGHFLHTIFWNNMSPEPGEMSKTLLSYIKNSFGSDDNFMKYFISSASKVEGSGWGILAYQPVSDSLVILQAEKHQNLGQWVSIPILVCDVWEHAYYLRYQNDRTAYLGSWMKSVVDWGNVSARLDYLIEAHSK